MITTAFFRTRRRGLHRDQCFDSRFPIPDSPQIRPIARSTTPGRRSLTSSPGRRSRKEQWEGNYAMKVAPDALVTRASAAAQDGSFSSSPFLAAAIR